MKAGFKSGPFNARAVLQKLPPAEVTTNTDCTDATENSVESSLVGLSPATVLKGTLLHAERM